MVSIREMVAAEDHVDDDDDESVGERKGAVTRNNRNKGSRDDPP